MRRGLGLTFSAHQTAWVCQVSCWYTKMHINDTDSIFDKTICPVLLSDIELYHLIYADDLILLSASSGGLQNYLNSLGSHSQKLDLTVNIKKVRLRFSTQPVKWSQGTHSPSLVASKRILLSWYPILNKWLIYSCYQKREDKVNKAMYSLIDMEFKFNLRMTTSMNFFDKLIQTIMLYGSEVWGALSHHHFKGTQPYIHQVYWNQQFGNLNKKFQK